ncbi:hypothetical protein AVEN_101193-1 [Araneus ventricosus]|uniref:Uncharacterized protein n=1 Tax=Araneus ventricosus TaxID=182803 RepID=A0A4Y2TYV3_ARAVE|nr:hypothetical protein AVEN_101193-1 [Araneus ventricosus]
MCHLLLFKAPLEHQRQKSNLVPAYEAKLSYYTLLYAHLFTLNLFATVPFRAPSQGTQSQYSIAFGISSILSNFPDNSNSPESDQRPAPISSNSLGSTGLTP